MATATSKQQTVTPTGITAYDTEPIFSGNILEYNGTYYRIGEGHKEFIPDKAMDEDYYLLTLMAVARELNAYGIREADVHLAAGLPLTWVRKQREDFRTYLLRNEYVSFHFNGRSTSSILSDAVCSLKVIPLLSADWAISREPISLQTSETAP